MLRAGSAAIRSIINSQTKFTLTKKNSLHTSSIIMAIQRVKIANANDAPKKGSLKDFIFAGEGDDAVKVLLTNVNGTLHATSAKCTHYGAPLANGVLTSHGKIICPWHGACFDAKTGDIEESPALDNLLSFKVEQDSQGDIYVEADPEQLKGKPGIPPSCSKSSSANGPGVVIVGGGSAAINVAESARKSGFTGKITIFTAEKHAPIDRTKLSKALIGSPEPVTWRSASHLKNVLNVDLKESFKATSIDVQGKKVTFNQSESVPFESLVLASGGVAKRLPLPGVKEGELQHVYTLRGVGDVSTILSAVGDQKDKEVVIVGTSFIGMEVAIALQGQEKAKSVSVVGMDEVPFEKILGKEVGEGLMKVAQKKGIQFYNSAGVERIDGKDGKASAVVIKDETGKQVSLSANVVILGVGAAPATDYIRSSSGFPELLKDGSIAVEKDLRVKGLPKDANIFACGDIATIPARDEQGASVRIEHWNVAGNQGRSVGRTLAGDSNNKYDSMPIFWSALGSQLRFVSDGNPPGYDDIYLNGNPEELKFSAFYGKNGKVTAVCTMGVDPLMVHSAELMRTGKMPSFSEIKGGKDPLSIPLATSSL